MSPQVLQRLADEELGTSCRGGDVRAFEVVYDRHGSSAFSAPTAWSETEVLPQEAFLSIWRRRYRYERIRRSWMLGIVHPERSMRATQPGPRAAACQREGIEEREEAPELTDVEAVRRDEAREIPGRALRAARSSLGSSTSPPSAASPTLRSRASSRCRSAR
jgi:hypothetical protein